MESRDWSARDGQPYEVRLYRIRGQPSEIVCTRPLDGQSWRTPVRSDVGLVELGAEELEGLLERARERE